jgi:hypothetical protein
MDQLPPPLADLTICSGLDAPFIPTRSPSGAEPLVLACAGGASSAMTALTGSRLAGPE